MKEQFKKLHLEARKAKDNVKKDTYESVLSAMQIKEIELQRSLTDSEVTNVIHKVIKQYRETAEALESRGDSSIDQVTSAKTLENLLPKAMTDAEIQELIDAHFDLSTLTKKDMGNVVKTIVALSEGRTDGKTVSGIVSKQL